MLRLGKEITREGGSLTKVTIIRVRNQSKYHNFLNSVSKMIIVGEGTKLVKFAPQLPNPMFQ